MAQRKAGIDPRLLINGLEPVSALAREYVANVGVARLAAESGATVSEMRERLARLPVELATSSRRVLAATASRAEADRILAERPSTRVYWFLICSGYKTW